MDFLPASKSPHDPLSDKDIELLFNVYKDVRWSIQYDFVVRLFEVGTNLQPLKLFSFMALSVNYPVASLNSSPAQIGVVEMAKDTSRTNAQISIETHDFVTGDIKRYFDKKAESTASRNGLGSVPAKHALFVQIIHGIRASKLNYSKTFLCKVGEVTTSMQYDGAETERLSIQMTEFDPFMVR